MPYPRAETFQEKASPVKRAVSAVDLVAARADTQLPLHDGHPAAALIDSIGARLVKRTRAVIPAR